MLTQTFQKLQRAYSYDLTGDDGARVHILRIIFVVVIVVVGGVAAAAALQGLSLQTRITKLSIKHTRLLHREVARYSTQSS